MTIQNNTSEFTVNDLTFKVRKIDAFKQFHTVRRIAPILSELMPALGKIKATMKGDDPESENLSEEEKWERIGEIAQPLLMGFSKLNDDDSEKVLHALLSGAEMQQVGGGWAPVSNGSMLMFQNLELPTLLQVAGRSFMVNLGGFFSILPQVSPGGAAKAKHSKQ